MQEHGSFDITCLNQTIIIKAIGSWNLETAVRYIKEYKRAVSLIKSNPWACLVDLTEWELATPDVVAYIAEFNAGGHSHNQKYEVVIHSLCLQKKLLANSHKVLTNVETKFCKNIEEAIVWLDSVGI